jgi:hypothetical protein
MVILSFLAVLGFMAGGILVGIAISIVVYKKVIK